MATSTSGITDTKKGDRPKDGKRKQDEQKSLFSKRFLAPAGIIRLKKATEEFTRKSAQLLAEYEEIAGDYDHTVRMMLLFKMWAPLYDAYWILTRHDEAARGVIQQLDAMGSNAKEQVFVGRGLEIGCGTGLVAHEIGRLKERVALRRLAHIRGGSVSKLAQICVRRQELQNYLLTDPDNFEKEFKWLSNTMMQEIKKQLEADNLSMSTGLMKVLYEIEPEDMNFRPLFEQYRVFRDMLGNTNTTMGMLLENPDTALLTLSYLRRVGLARSILESENGKMSHFRPVDKMELLTELRNELGKIINLTAIDISQDMLNLAREKVRDVYGGAVEGPMFLEEDGTKIIEIADEIGWSGKFDFAVIAQLLHILPDDDKVKILEGAAKVLKPEGKLVIIDEWSPLFSGENLETADSEVKNLLSQLELLFRFTFHPITGKGEMRKLIEDAGFDYSKKRASDVIDKKHNMYGHIYIKK